MYILYVVVIAFNQQIFKLFTGKELPVRPEEIVHSDDEEYNETSGKRGSFYSGVLDDTNPPSSGAGVFAYAKYIVLFPIFCVLSFTVPDVRMPGRHTYCYFSFSVSILWIGLFSYFMVGEYEVRKRYCGC